MGGGWVPSTVSFLCGNVAPGFGLHTKADRLAGMLAHSFLRAGTCAVCHAAAVAGCVTVKKSPRPLASDMGGIMRREPTGAVQCDGGCGATAGRGDSEVKHPTQ